MKVLVIDKEMGLPTTTHIASRKKSIIKNAWKEFSKKYELVKIIK